MTRFAQLSLLLLLGLASLPATAQSTAAAALIQNHPGFRRDVRKTPVIAIVRIDPSDPQADSKPGYVKAQITQLVKGKAPSVIWVATSDAETKLQPSRFQYLLFLEKDGDSYRPSQRLRSSVIISNIDGSPDHSRVLIPECVSLQEALDAIELCLRKK